MTSKDSYITVNSLSEGVYRIAFFNDAVEMFIVRILKKE
jgi:hypothetical protein